MQRLARLEHDVVGNVDDIVDGTNAARVQPKAHPGGRRTYAQIIDDSSRVTETQTPVLNRDAHSLGDACILGVGPDEKRLHPSAGQGRYLSSQSGYAQAVAAVRSYTDFE